MLRVPRALNTAGLVLIAQMPVKCGRESDQSQFLDSDLERENLGRLSA